MFDGHTSVSRQAKGKRDPATGNEDLCRRCLSLNLSDFPKRRTALHSRDYVADLGFVKEWDTLNCRFCSLLASVADQWSEAEGKQLTLSVSHSRLRPNENPERFNHSTYFCIHYNDEGRWCAGKRFYIRDPSPEDSDYLFSVRRLEPGSIDYSVLRGWIDHCSMHHEERCALVRNRISRLRVIDCRTNEVIDAPDNCEFVALSYVWGTNPVPIVTSMDNMTPIAKVVEDAMIVVLKLGFFYLWVDKHCIFQANREDLKHQINNMGEIYSQSSLTIIAAAGSDANYGLPGVNSVHRIPQRYCRIGSRDIIAEPPSAAEALNKSKWNTRGWTFQEALLSRRRLLFTDHEVCFECAISHRCESFDVPDSKLPNNEILDLDSERSAFLDVGGQRHEIYRVIGRFASRDFTREEDALDALSGVFKHYQMMEPPVEFIWGMPNAPGPAFPHDRQCSLERLLCWRFFEPGKRREGFPSWSWVGWKGKIDSFASDCVYSSELSLELEGGSIVDREGFEHFQEQSTDPVNLSKYIHVRDKTTVIRFVEREKAKYCYPAGQSHSIHAEFSVTGNKYYSPLYLRAEIDKHGSFYQRMMTHGMEVLILGYGSGTPNGLLLNPIGDHYEAIGTLHLPNLFNLVKSKSTVKTFRIG